MVNVSLGTLKTSFQADFLDAEGVQNHDGMDIDNDKDKELHVKMKVWSSLFCLTLSTSALADLPGSGFHRYLNFQTLYSDLYK